MPRSEKVGEIKHISEMKIEPLPHKVATVQRENNEVEAMIYQTALDYSVGDLVLIQEDAQFPEMYNVSDIVRTPTLIRLLIIFVMAILVVTGATGLRSLVGLVFSFWVIFKMVLPEITAGGDPLTVALSASLLILFISYFLTHGIRAKSVIAIIGTLGALVVTGVLSVIYGSLAKLSGFGTEEAMFLIGNLPTSSFYNLYLAGIIIGSLGVLDDITISQAGIVEELATANKKLGFRELYARAMRIGHDHIASVVNTLVLVYAGSALPLLLLFISSQASPIELLNYEAVAEEIVKTLVASIGLVAAVPLTTLIAGLWYSGKV